MSRDHLHDFHLWTIETRKGRKTPFRVRWTVAGRQFGRSFATMALAESFRASLITAARNGEGFDTESGLPESMERTPPRHHVLPARSRIRRRGVARRRGQDPRVHHRSPDPRRPRRHPRAGRHTRPGRPAARTAQGPQPGRARRRARRARGQGHRLARQGIPPGQRPRRPLSRLRRPRRPGRQPRRQARRPRILLPPPPRPAPRPRLRRPQEAARPRTRSAKATCPKAGAPRKPRTTPSTRAPSEAPPWSPPCSQACGTVGRTARPPVPGVLRLHVLRHDAPLRSRRAHPGRLPPARAPAGATSPSPTPAPPQARPTPTTARSTSTAASKAAPRAGPAPEPAGPSGRSPSRPSSSQLLRAHLQQFGAAPDGRLFRSENGTPLQPSTWWQVWQKVRATSLTPGQLASPLMKRPYDLRHSGVTWRLNSGVPATEVAAWAGHSVEMLMRVYARCVDRARARLDRPHGRRPAPRGGPVTWAAMGRGRVWGAESVIRRHPVACRVRGCQPAVRVPAGQARIDADSTRRPQQDSNLRSRLRRPLLSPLSYGG